MSNYYSLVRRVCHIENVRSLFPIYSQIQHAINFKYMSTEAKKVEETEKTNEVNKTENEIEEKESENVSMEKYAEMEELLRQSKDEAADFKDKYVRSLAENENVRRRAKKQLEDSKLYAIQSFCKDLLEVADILEKATESVPKEELSKSSHLKSLFDGLTMTETQLQKVFKSHGLEKVHPLNEKFDPNFHEALFQLPGEISGTVAVVQKTGYRLHGRPLRAALVGVVK